MEKMTGKMFRWAYDLWVMSPFFVQKKLKHIEIKKLKGYN